MTQRARTLCIHSQSRPILSTSLKHLIKNNAIKFFSAVHFLFWYRLKTQIEKTKSLKASLCKNEIRTIYELKYFV